MRRLTRFAAFSVPTGYIRVGADRTRLLDPEDTMNSTTSEAEALLTPAEVAAMFRVDPKTVTRWAKAGKLSSIRTLGGHRRYRESEVRALLSGALPEQRTSDNA
jgi:excisionase family DNA binding protein